MIVVSISVIRVGLSVPLVAYFISAALKRREQSWVEVGKVDDLSTQEPKQLTCLASVRDGYMETTMHKAVWAVKKDHGEVMAFALKCTHLGGYRWVTYGSSNVPAMAACLTSMVQSLVARPLASRSIARESRKWPPLCHL
jgi:hypothetical protein